MIFQIDVDYDGIDDLVKQGMEFCEKNPKPKPMLQIKDEDLKPFFLDLVKKHNLGTKVWGVGIHAMRPGTSSPAGHTHAKARGVFYIQAPEGVGHILFPNLNEDITPHKGLFVVVPAKEVHAMSENKSDEIRLIYAFYIE